MFPLKTEPNSEKGYILCLQVNWNLSAFYCSFPQMRENLRGLMKKFKTQNPCLKSNSVAGIWTSLWLHCFSWSESLAHEIHPTFWGCFVFTSFSLIYLFFFFFFLFLFFVFDFHEHNFGIVFWFRFWLEVCWWFFFYVYVWFTNVIANCFFFKLFLSYVLISRLW